ncbi:MAG: protein-L-isoaspartate(D-aspartate) O-methyltransferase [Syntrophales bacterium]|nr:protein-L-isoaspartate(D-aspartate) O-methyltransferase [Syntrophales bacterium]
MVAKQIRARGISDTRVLEAMEEIPRHLFVDEALLNQAYADNPLPIGERQTISQPYIVALMTESLELTGYDKVLEIGTGSGYQTAILSRLADRVVSVERIASLSSKARKILDRLKCYNVLTVVGDGTFGWKDEAPYDAIIVTAGAPEIPKAYLDQLAVGGRLVIPVGGSNSQNLMKVTRRSGEKDDLEYEELGGCRFVSLIGEHGWKG